MLKNFIIFGDSYSTYCGHVPKGYAYYYSPDGTPERPVKKMRLDKVWWQRLMALDDDARLIRNDSWSGSTISYTGWDGDTSLTSSFIYRFRTLKNQGFFENNRIDTVLIFGGTNDSWVPAPLGKMKFSDWKEEDLFSAFPAICHFIYSIKSELPHGRIVFIVNNDIKSEIIDCIKTAGEYYKIDVVCLNGIDKQYGHPTVLGMEQICNQVYSFLKS